MIDVKKTKSGFVVSFNSNIQGEWCGRKVLVKHDHKADPMPLDATINEFGTTHREFIVHEAKLIGSCTAPAFVRILRKGWRVQ